MFFTYAIYIIHKTLKFKQLFAQTCFEIPSEDLDVM